MISLTEAAQEQLDGLIAHYVRLGRDNAIDRLAENVEAACVRFRDRRGLFFDAPRPYPALRRLGFRWTKEGSYWVAFRESYGQPVVAGIFHESADIPNRV